MFDFQAAVYEMLCACMKFNSRGRYQSLKFENRFSVTRAIMAERRPRRAAARIALQNLDIAVSDDSEEEPVFNDPYSSSDDEDPPSVRNSQQQEWHFVDAEMDSLPVPVPEFFGYNGMDPQLNVSENLEDIGSFISTFITDDLLEKVAHWTYTKAEKQFRNCLAEDIECPQYWNNGDLLPFPN